LTEAEAAHQPASQVARELFREYVQRQREARDYDNFLRQKVEAGRASMPRVAVEPAFCPSAVRIIASGHGDRRASVKIVECGSPGRIIRRCAPHPFGAALAGVQRRFASLSNRLFVRRRFELTRLAMVTDERL
jgi:hypothetical protein